MMLWPSQRLNFWFQWRRATILAFAGVVTAMLWASVAIHLKFARVEAVDRELKNLSNLSRSFEEHTTRIFETVDQMLLAIKRLHEHGESIDTIAQMAAANTDLIHLVSVANRQGDVTFSTSSGPSVNLADREHFRVHAEDIAVGLYISKPVIGRQSGKWSMQFSRRLDTSDRSFDGIVVIALNPFYFADFFRSVDLGTDGVAALIGQDGVVRARVSQRGDSIGADVSDSPLFDQLTQSPRGTFFAVGRADGVGRYISYQSLGQYGMTVAVGMAEADLLGPIDRQTMRVYLAAAVLTVTILLLTLAVLVQISRLQRSEAAARASRQTAETARAEAKAAHDRMAEAVDAMSESFALFDKEDRLVLWNRRYADSNPGIRDVLAPGIKFETLLREGVRKGQIGIPEEQREAWIADRMRYRANPSGKIERYQSNGMWVLIEERRTPEGETVSFGADITELKRRESQLRESEEKYRSVVDTVMEVIFQVDPAGKWTFLNPAWARITGYAIDAAIGTKFIDHVHPDDRVNVTLGDESKASGVPSKRQKFRLLTRGGGFRWVELFAQTVRNAQGDVTGASGTLTDVTDQHLAEERLRAAKDEADRASRAKSEFLAVMSHEIRTPLNGVLGTIGLLLETGLNAAQRRYAETAHESGAMLLAILNDILDFSKMEAGRLELETIDFRVRDRIRTVVDLLQPRALAKRIDLDLNINPDVPIALRGDPGRLGQILLNLLSNAIKFTDAGRVALDVRLDAVTTDGAWLNFSISDTGVGIARQDIDKLFSSFTQVDSSRSRRASGTGLGLAICKKLVGLMGGVIGVESAPGTGSKFWFTVPFCHAEHVPPPDFAIDAEARDGVVNSRRGRILIVDDSPTNLLVASGYLEGVGFTVDTVDNGAAAIVAVQETQYDVVLMDISMPVMDGIIATSEIRALGGRFRTLPVIAMTAHALDKDRAACFEAGMSDYVAKPVDKKRLIAVIDRFLTNTSEKNTFVGVAQSPDKPAMDVAGSAIDDQTLAALKAELDEDTFACLIDTFLTETQDRLERLRVARAEGNRDALAREAHSLKSSAATFGAHALSRLAAAIEQTVADNQSFPDEAELSKLTQHASAACDALKLVQAA